MLRNFKTRVLLATIIILVFVGLYVTRDAKSATTPESVTVKVESLHKSAVYGKKVYFKVIIVNNSNLDYTTVGALMSKQGGRLRWPKMVYSPYSLQYSKEGWAWQMDLPAGETRQLMFGVRITAKYHYCLSVLTFNGLEDRQAGGWSSGEGCIKVAR